MNQSKDKYIISEFYGFNMDDNLLKEAYENNGTITIKCILQKADALNRNGRVYPYAILKREVDKYNELVKEGSAMGEVDHPSSPIVSLVNVSHIVTKMWWEDTTLFGEIKIADTKAGEIVKGLLKSGIKLGISSRGVGSVKNQGGKDIVQEDFELIAFDIVSSPSTIGAYLFNESKNWGLRKLTDDSIKTMKEENPESADKIDNFYKKISQLSEDKFWKI